MIISSFGNLIFNFRRCVTEDVVVKTSQFLMIRPEESTKKVAVTGKKDAVTGKKGTFAGIFESFRTPAKKNGKNTP